MKNDVISCPPKIFNAVLPNSLSSKYLNWCYANDKNEKWYYYDIVGDDIVIGSLGRYNYFNMTNSMYFEPGVTKDMLLAMRYNLNLFEDINSYDVDYYTEEFLAKRFSNDRTADPTCVITDETKKKFIAVGGCSTILSETVNAIKGSDSSVMSDLYESGGIFTAGRRGSSVGYYSASFSYDHEPSLSEIYADFNDFMQSTPVVAGGPLVRSAATTVGIGYDSDSHTVYVIIGDTDSKASGRILSCGPSWYSCDVVAKGIAEGQSLQDLKLYSYDISKISSMDGVERQYLYNNIFYKYNRA